MVDLYIYYQVRAEHAPALAPRMQALQARLRASHGIAGRLLRRPEASAGLQTWMEVYPATEDGFDAVLAQALDDAAVSAMIEGQRHIEIFSEISPCA